MADAPILTRSGDRGDDGRFVQSQTLERIPAGLVLNRAESLESLTVQSNRGTGPKRTVRQRK